MAKIKFAKNYDPIEVKPEETLMHQLRDAGLPVASSCGGFGICGKCRVKVIMGKENLTPMSDDEKNCLTNNIGNPEEVRLSCQVEVSGEILIDTDYW